VLSVNTNAVIAVFAHRILRVLKRERHIYRRSLPERGNAVTTVTIDKSIDVDCSRHEAFDKLSRVESYAQFQSQFEGVEEIQVRGGNKAHIVGNVAGRREEFDLELAAIPEERIDYRYQADAATGGSLTLHKLDDQRTRLQLHAEYDPQKVRDLYHLSQQDVDQRAQARLELMKSIAESKTGS
jgi:hypothetical protein